MKLAALRQATGGVAGLDDEHILASAREIRRTNQAVVAGADDYGVVLGQVPAVLILPST